MSYLIQPIQDRDLAYDPNTQQRVPMVATYEEPVAIVNGPYPYGFAPPAFFEIGSVVSANNQRPAGNPIPVHGPLALVTDHLPEPVQDDTRFVAKLDPNLPQVKSWKTNSRLQSESDTYADGVKKNQLMDEDTPAERERAIQTINSLEQQAAEFRRQARDALRKAQNPDNSDIQRHIHTNAFDNLRRQAEEKENEAKTVRATYNINPMTGRPFPVPLRKGQLVYSPEGQTAVFGYGNAQPFRSPYQFINPGDANQQFQTRAGSYTGVRQSG